MTSNKTTVRRSWGKTFAMLGGGIAAAALSVVLFATIVEGTITAGIAVVPALAALILIWQSITGAASAPCPSCGATVFALATGNNDGKCCEKCHLYLEGQRGELWVTDPNRIADRPIFRAGLGEQFTWPAGCCVCGQQATRRLPATITVQTGKSAGGNAAAAVLTGGSLLVTGGGSKITVEVPHCDAHKDGADLSAPGGVNDVRIVFRSYPYMRAFCSQNGTLPG